MEEQVPLSVVTRLLPSMVDASVLSTEFVWLRNGERGVAHVHRSPQFAHIRESKCRRFKASARVASLTSSVPALLAQDASVCEPCAVMALNYAAAQSGVPTEWLIDGALLRDDVARQVEAGIAPLAAAQLRGRVDLAVSRLDSLSSRDMPDLATQFTRSLRADLDVTASTLEQAVRARADLVHASSVHALMELPAYDEPDWLISEDEAVLLGCRYRVRDSVVPSVYTEWLSWACAQDDPDDAPDRSVLRAQALEGLLDGGLVSLDQLAMVPADLVVSQVSASAGAVLTQVAGDDVVRSGLSQAWRMAAVPVLEAMVARWEARLDVLLADVEPVLIAVGMTDGVDVALTTVAQSGVVLSARPVHDGSLRVLTRVSGASALLLEQNADEPGSYWTSLVVARVPQGFDDATLETALALWDPWDGDSSYCEFADALSAARALSFDGPVPRRVRVSAAAASAPAQGMGL